MWTASTPFAPPGTKLELEEGAVLTPRFNADGLISAIAVDHATREILMLAHMNAEALAKTLESGDVWYFSRSRNELWRKGATSGHTQRLVEMRVDCDQDAVILIIEQVGPACHTNRRSCFYRKVMMVEGRPVLKTGE
ncbi:MAG: phosphoribosyl-AMP cyclohydrolase [Proteobacteria bacterium]|nr:phosphoribosyl-AMP cyclohydrolase [Pseudomonadota bacterium]